MHILLASTNPSKIKGTKQAFAEFPEIFGPEKDLVIDAQKFPSNVPDQPIGFEQTLTGAYNRAFNAKASDKANKYDYYVGIESGMVFLKNKPYVFSFACVVNKKAQYYFGTNIVFPIPEKIQEFLAQGKEVADFAEWLTKIQDVRSQNGISGYLFNDKYPRTEANKLAVFSALAGFIKKEKFSTSLDQTKIPKIVYISTSITTGVNKDLPLQITKWVEETGAIVNDKNVIYAGHDNEIRKKYMKDYANKYLNTNVPPQTSPDFGKLIYELDSYLVDQATHMIIILDKTSFGVAMELEKALLKPARGLQKTKILGIIHKDNYAKLSKMVEGSAEKYDNFTIVQYTDIKELPTLIKNFMV